MAWNEPGGGDKDPWGGQGGNQGPPDLDEIVRKMQNRFGGLFNGGRGSSDGGGKGGGKFGIGLIAIVAVIVWALSGIYIIDEGKRGVVLQFGQFTKITMPGPHWLPYFIQTVEIVDTEQVRFVPVGYSPTGRGNATIPVPREALMLTQDENIINVQIAVQYQVKNARDYLFNVRDPDLTLKQATESALREVIGKSKMDFVLTEGRAEVVERTKELVQAIMDQYEAGLIITNVNLQDAQPPEEVQGAFADAIKAREDEQRQKNEAETYANDVLPKARGAAARLLEEANGYKLSVIAQAEGEASRFDQLRTEYAKAPEVTRKRLYLEALEDVLSSTSKVTIDAEGNNMLYLPLDQLMQGGAAIAGARRFQDYGAESGVTSSPSSSGERISTRRDTRGLREPRQ